MASMGPAFCAAAVSRHLGRFDFEWWFGSWFVLVRYDGSGKHRPKLKSPPPGAFAALTITELTCDAGLACSDSSGTLSKLSATMLATHQQHTGPPSCLCVGLSS